MCMTLTPPCSIRWRYFSVLIYINAKPQSFAAYDRMTHSSWYAAARTWRMRAEETRALAEEMKEAEPNSIMLRIAADYEKLAEWGEKTQRLSG